MNEQNYQTVKLDDIVFEGRNKSYGAYMLRQLHEKHVRRGLLVSSLLMLFGFTFPLLAEKLGLYTRFANRTVTLSKIKLEQPPSLDTHKPVPPLVAPPPPPPVRPTIRFIELEPKKDDIVKKEDPPPPPDELKKADIAATTKQGDENAKPTLNTEDDSKGTVVEAPPKPAVEDKPKVDVIFVTVEQNPEFANGGIKGMYEWLSKNIKYPAIARENGIEGRAIVQFVVETDGSVSQVNCVRGPEGGCKEEAAHVVAMMPKWIPGKQQGRPVRVRYTIPVVFKLE